MVLKIFLGCSMLLVRLHCSSVITLVALSPFRLLCILVQTVREMVAFALLSTGCCSQAMVLCSHFPFCSIRLNRMSCHHPSCLWYIVNQVQFLLGFLALCRASHKTRRDTKTLKSQVLTLPLSWLFFAAAWSYPAALQLPNSISPTLQKAGSGCPYITCSWLSYLTPQQSLRVLPEE